ncbi:hypothetical protein [Halosimplex halophilum]|uniref:hypothetical protein n=1 Tax=Halosimplex halophilum TaxID=2559572 RepID=UPI00107F25C7|nr:hypothetical protein [Halosimplex halophilum]
MVTSVKTLREYADMLDEIADDWEGEQPLVLIGDVTGSVNISADDGFSKYGPVGFAQECFDGNGVFELGQKADTRFFGTMLLHPEHVVEDALDEKDICRYCYHRYEDCTCPEVEEATAGGDE